MNINKKAVAKRCDDPAHRSATAFFDEPHLILRERVATIMNRRNSSAVAYCGIIGALSFVIMMLGGLLPFSEFSAPALAGILFFPLVIEFGHRWAFTVYMCVSLLSLLIIFNLETPLLFISFFGYYPILKSRFEALKSKFITGLLKASVFNTAIILVYAASYFIFKLSYIIEEFKDYKWYVLIPLLILGNVTFFIYDYAVTKLIVFYMIRIRKYFFRD